MTGRIFITGDKHRTMVPLFRLAERVELQKTDVLLIAGDAGYVWNDDYPYTIKSLEQIFPGTIAFIDGNHENHTILNGMGVSVWQGGKVHRVGERVLHWMRGEVYDLYGKTFFAFGGGQSVDKDRREEGVSWWKEEEPTEAEMEYGTKQLQAHQKDIDYVITHEPPFFARGQIARQKELGEAYRFPHLLEQWYRLLETQERFQMWYFGHMHVDQTITPKLRGLHQDILLLETGQSIW